MHLNQENIEFNCQNMLVKKTFAYLQKALRPKMMTEPYWIHLDPTDSPLRQ